MFTMHARKMSSVHVHHCRHKPRDNAEATSELLSNVLETGLPRGRLTGLFGSPQQKTGHTLHTSPTPGPSLPPSLTVVDVKERVVGAGVGAGA